MKDKSQAKALIGHLRKVHKTWCGYCGRKRYYIINQSYRDGAWSYGVTVYCGCSRTEYQEFK